MGLAYNKIGGSSLMIETSLASIKKGKQSIKLSGNLGKSMSDSMLIAYSFARNFLKKIKNDFLEK